MKRLKALAFAALAAACTPSHAGYDIVGIVSQVQLRPDGNLWFSLVPSAGYAPITNFCAAGQWNDLNLLVPANNPQYPYYYGLLLTAMLKAKPILLANISVFNGTTSCDITQTGYGIVLRP